MEMNSQTVKAGCEGVQTYYGKVKVLSHSLYTLTHLFRSSVQTGVTPEYMSQGQAKDTIKSK